ncbi:DUF2924 domain-containing protein [Polynucleobacter sp. JS-Safj-400b-B2]|uniref:DUF2924 domain-containing protein n=1 Tax=Polynucleobacter sp. JS-Safj-400b-B2 TaxID=2576921 RepID=UPI001C0D4B37|nr:DUF2924 domain-containing protein [Polynucleobacter sp. JS-Safj-400b-B2]MBU3626610.1 DUF2924 domain-containing protein [Polynucleobacter sp. JS-Safj-400b-B2]
MSADIKEQLLELETLSRSALAVRWQACFGVSAPHLCRSALLRQVIAWQMQSTVNGGLTALERRQIQSGSPKPSMQASTGSRLVRVWQGKTHQVTVLECGYLYEGKTWKSLSAIARHVTGTPWSGPVFFGLKKANAKPMGVINTKDSMENQNP